MGAFNANANIVLNPKKKIIKNKFSKENLFKNNIFVFDDLEGYEGNHNEIIRVIEGIKNIFKSKEKSNEKKLKFLIIVNNEEIKNPEKFNLNRLIEKLESKVIEVNNRQGFETINNQFQKNIIQIENDTNNGEPLFNNMRILNKISKKYQELNPLKKSNNNILKKIWINKKEDILQLIIKLYYDMEPSSQIKKTFEKIFKISEKQNNQFAKVQEISNYDFDIKKDWKEVFISTYSWENPYIYELYIYFYYNTTLEKFKTKIEKLEKINKTKKQDYIDKLLLKTMYGEKIENFDSKKFFQNRNQEINKLNETNLQKISSHCNDFIQTYLFICFYINIKIDKSKIKNFIQKIINKEKQNNKIIKIAILSEIKLENDKMHQLNFHNISSNPGLNEFNEKLFFDWIKMKKIKKEINEIIDNLLDQFNKNISEKEIMECINDIFQAGSYNRLKDNYENHWIINKIKNIDIEKFDEKIFLFLYKNIKKNNNVPYLVHIFGFLESFLEIFYHKKNDVYKQMLTLLKKIKNNPNFNNITFENYIKYYKQMLKNKSTGDV